jgi:FADH2 O2-dependent halogenase
LYDIIIVGSGIFGSSLAAILARHGVRVLLLDASKHPRFAIGESTVRDTTQLLKILSKRFDVPELEDISSFLNTQTISSECGLKRNFGFVYQRLGQKQNPKEVYQIVIPDLFEGPEIHYYRQTIDHYLFEVAKQYGASVKEQTRLTEIDILADGVTAKTEAGDIFKAQYIVDATGFKSLLANKYGLRQQTCRFKTHSRSIFTHMEGVKRYEECPSGKLTQVPRRWSEGTLHHCFDGGWIWIIPFNNAPNSQNTRVSVGVQLDPRKYPDTGAAPEDEWNSVLSMLPSVAEQFENAIPVRPWISTRNRLQYSSHSTIKDRFCLASHAAGFIDPLYSRGLPLSLNTLLLLANELLSALSDRDFTVERFEHIDRYQQNALNNIDSLVSGSYTACQSFELWNAWLRIWYASANLSTINLQATYKRYLQSGDPKVLTAAYAPNWGSLCPQLTGFQPFFDEMVQVIDGVQENKIPASVAASKIFDSIQNADFIPPVFNLGCPEINNGGSFDANHLWSLIHWGNHLAPQEVKEKLFPGDPKQNLTKLRQEFDAFEHSDRYSSVRDLLKSLS